jgi:hypothetical protein
MLSLGIFLAVTPVSDIVFDQVGRVHAGLSQASFTATSKLTGTGETVQAKYEIKYRWPSAYRLRIMNPGNGQLLRDHSIEPSRVVEYDPSLGQFTSSERKRGDSLGKTLAELDPNLDDILLAFTDPKGVEVWLDSMEPLRPWSVSVGRSTVKMSYAKGERKIVLETERATARVKRIDITTGPQRLEWTLAYQPRVSNLAFVAPDGVYEVPLFDREMRPPTYKDAVAKRTAEKVFDAYSGLSEIGYKVERDSGTTTVYLRGKFARQDDESATWVYDGTTLTLFQKKSKKWYRGKLGFPDVVDAVGSLGTRVDPTLRLLMTGFNAYRKRLGDGASVSVVGTMKVGGEPVTILESVSENALISLVVRDRDGRVISSQTRANEQGDLSIETVDLSYEYIPVPRDAQSRLKLTVPAGTRPVKLEPRPVS